MLSRSQSGWIYGVGVDVSNRDAVDRALVFGLAHEICGERAGG